MIDYLYTLRLTLWARTSIAIFSIYLPNKHHIRVRTHCALKTGERDLNGRTGSVTDFSLSSHSCSLALEKLYSVKLGSSEWLALQRQDKSSPRSMRMLREMLLMPLTQKRESEECGVYLVVARTCLRHFSAPLPLLLFTGTHPTALTSKSDPHNRRAARALLPTVVTLAVARGRETALASSAAHRLALANCF